MLRVHVFRAVAGFLIGMLAGLSCVDAEETLTAERIEADWLRQDEVRGIPVQGGPVKHW